MKRRSLPFRTRAISFVYGPVAAAYPFYGSFIFLDPCVPWAFSSAPSEGRLIKKALLSGANKEMARITRLWRYREYLYAYCRRPSTIAYKSVEKDYLSASAFLIIVFTRGFSVSNEYPGCSSASTKPSFLYRSSAGFPQTTSNVKLACGNC